MVASEEDSIDDIKCEGGIKDVPAMHASHLLLGVRAVEHHLATINDESRHLVRHHALNQLAAIRLGDRLQHGGHLGDLLSGANQAGSCLVGGVCCLNDVGGAAGDWGAVLRGNQGVGGLCGVAVDVAAQIDLYQVAGGDGGGVVGKRGEVPHAAARWEGGET